MPPVNPRRQTLAGVQAKPPAMPTSSSSRPSVGGNASVSGGSNAAPAARRRVPLSRKSMIPRCAGGTSSGSGGGLVDNTDRENNGRASGIAAPSPSRHPSGGGSRLPPTTASSRKSLGGLQYNSHTTSSTSSSTPAKNRRVSLAPTNSSTIPGSSSNIDPRDIKDKSYLQNAIRKMVSYLTTRGYRDASSLSVKQLVNNGPSGRDFQNIMTFLFRRMDPTFFVPPTPGNQRSDEIVPKFEDEVSMAFRFLGYPFPISKTGLVAVGSPHTWPALIAAIDWLVDLLLLRDDEEQFDWEPDEMTENECSDWLTFNGNADRIKKQYHKFLRKSMVAFLNDNSEECEELEGNLLDTFQRDCERVERYVTGLDEECGNMREDIAVLNEEANCLPDAHRKQEECATNIEKFLSLIQTLNEHKAELTTKVETLAIEKSTMEQEQEDCVKKIGQLKQTINGQELSQEDVRRMEREKARIEEQVAKQSSILDGHIAALTEVKEKWSSLYQLLEDRITEYKMKARQLELIPKSAKHAKGAILEVVLVKSKAADGEVELMGGMDFGRTVKGHVTKTAQEYESELAKEQRSTADVNGQIRTTDRSFVKLIEDIEAIKDKTTSGKEECDQLKVGLETEINDNVRELESIQTKISSINDPTVVESNIAKIDAEYKQLKARQQQTVKEHVVTKKAVTDEIQMALTAIQEYEVDKREQLDGMNAYIRQKKEEFDKLKLMDS
ncbi:hypothetical protein ACHAWU_005954 [Discostella pseudostelligera]|uniref:Kinetochore protein NDC80 n=1 Tax=Discostella pseudostelligera TaxID=259834 RepID=A0ABD3M8T2_9STRA